MAVITCEMCGGELEIKPGDNVAVCKYCGTKQTISLEDEDSDFEEKSKNEAKTESPEEESFRKTYKNEQQADYDKEFRSLFGKDGTDEERELRERKAREEWERQQKLLNRTPEEIIYEKAWNLAFANADATIAELEEAKSLFEKIVDYEDSEEQIVVCKRKIELLKSREKFKQTEKQHRKNEHKGFGKIWLIVGGVVLFWGTIASIGSFMERGNRYEEAMALYDSGQYDEAYAIFSNMLDYKDSRAKAEDSRAKAEEIENSYRYERAEDLTQIGIYGEALALYEAMPDYRDVDEKIREVKYLQANEMYENGQYEDAYALFSEISENPQAAEKLNELKEIKYQQATAEWLNQNYADALTLFVELGDYKDSASYVREIKYYIQAGQYLDEEKYNLAMKFYIELGDYGESRSQAVLAFNGLKSQLNETVIGDQVCLGFYEQDGYRSNGDEEIEWIVLDRQEDNLLLLSLDILDWQPYHGTEEAVTWATSDLRKWLIEEFYPTAFPGILQEAVEEVTLRTLGDVEGSTDGGRDTQDKVFLLSCEEVELYKEIEEVGPFVWLSKALWDSPASNSQYWTRSSGQGQNRMKEVNQGNNAGLRVVINYDIKNVMEYSGVRPAIWVNLNASLEV